jgi:hypothetical protein
MSDNRRRELRERIITVEAELAKINAKISTLSIDSMDTEVAGCLRLKSVLELKLSLGQEEIKRIEERAGVAQRAESRATDHATMKRQEGQRRVQSARERIPILEQLIADPHQPKHTDGQLESARAMGLAAGGYLSGIRAEQKEAWRKELATLQSSLESETASATV